MFRFLCLFAILSAFTACSEADSCTIKTSGLVFTGGVETISSGHITTSTWMRVGDANSLTYVTLCPQDRLSVKVNNIEQSMIGTGWGIYSSAFNNVAAGDTVQFLLYRSGSDEDATDTTVKVATAMTAATASPDTNINTTNQAIDLTWGDTSQEGTVSIEMQPKSGCTFTPRSHTIENDLGAAQIPAGTISPKPILNVGSSTCRATITIKRTILGIVDAALDPDSTLTATAEIEKEVTLQAD